MFKSLKRSAKGAAVPHTKATAGQPTNKMPVPEHVVIPMSMHIGAPAEPVVKKGDTVMVGTVIGKAGGFVSANIYSSVSGTVQDIAPLRMVNGAGNMKCYEVPVTSRIMISQTGSMQTLVLSDVLKTGNAKASGEVKP